MKVIVYGAAICPDCVAAKEQVTRHKDVELDFRDITSSTAIMKEFLKLRDTESCFEPVKENGMIGIPFFILEDGTKTFHIEKYIDVDPTVERIGQACSLDGHNC